MNVSSYLEGFLTIYGWMLYETIYQLMSMIWLIFLPFLMLSFNFFRDTITDISLAGYGHFKKSMFTFVLMLMTMFTCLVPIHSIKINDSKVNSVCQSAESLKSFYNQGGSPNKYRFSGTEQGKVPLLPSLVMRIAQGTNNVIFKSTPCVASVSNMALAFNSSKINDPGLTDMMDLFTEACWKPASTKLTELSSRIGAGFVNRLAENLAEKEGTTANHQKHFMGSALMQMMMEGGQGYSSALNAAAQGNERQLFKEIMSPEGKSTKLYSANNVSGIVSDYPYLSERQRARGEGPVSCKRWYTTMRPLLLDDAYTSLAVVANQDDAINCKVSQSPTSGILGESVNKLLAKQCTDVDKFFNATSSKEKRVFGDKILMKAQDYYTGNAALSDKDSTTLNTAAGGIGLLSVVGMFFPVGDSVLESITGSATSFYADMYMYKTVARFLQPMLLMGIFMFWGIYLIVSSYRGETVFKGLVLIFALTILPSIWGIADHLDSYLYQALYPGVDVAELTSRKEPTIERIILDAASTAFYVIFPFILLYMISEAGGPRGDKAVQSTGQQASTISGKVGGAASNSTTNQARAGKEYLQSKFKY